ncbi:hypothetical protein M1116_04405 [Patescibacteria group bacterium]|nr:hypothetical protein [Patescibacteria group bacterium]
MGHLTTKWQQGVVQVPVMLVLLFLALAIPITARLLQNNSADTRSRADYACQSDGTPCGGIYPACNCCSGGTHNGANLPPGAALCGAAPTAGGVCSGADMQCTNGQYRTCSGGQWTTYSRCSSGQCASQYACTTVTCNGTCQGGGAGMSCQTYGMQSGSGSCGVDSAGVSKLCCAGEIPPEATGTPPAGSYTCPNWPINCHVLLFGNCAFAGLTAGSGTCPLGQTCCGAPPANSTPTPVPSRTPSPQPTPTGTSCIQDGLPCGGVNGSCEMECCSAVKIYAGGSYFCGAKRLPTAAPRAWKFSDATIYIKRLFRMFTVQPAYAYPSELNDQGTCNYSYQGEWSWDCGALNRLNVNCNGSYGTVCGNDGSLCTTSSGGMGVCQFHSCCPFSSSCPGTCVSDSYQCTTGNYGDAPHVPGVEFPSGKGSCGSGICCIAGVAQPTPTPLLAQKTNYVCVCPTNWDLTNYFSSCKWVEESQVPAGANVDNNISCVIGGKTPPADCYKSGECDTLGVCNQCCGGNTFYQDDKRYCGTAPGVSNCSAADKGKYQCIGNGAFQCNGQSWGLIQQCDVCRVTSSGLGLYCVNASPTPTNVAYKNYQDCVAGCAGKSDVQGCVIGCNNLRPSPGPGSVTTLQECLEKNCQPIPDATARSMCVSQCQNVFASPTNTPVPTTGNLHCNDSASCDVYCRSRGLTGSAYDQCMSDNIPVPTAVPGVCNYSKQYCSSYTINGVCMGYCVPIPTAGPSPRPTSMPVNGQCPANNYCSSYVGPSGCMGYCVPVAPTPTKIPGAVVPTGTVPTSAPAPSGAPNPGPQPGPHPGPNPGTGCSYNSLQARVHQNDSLPLIQNLTVNQGQTVNMTCTHDGTGNLASNVKIVAVNSTDASKNQQWNSNKADNWAASAGLYTIYCQSTDSRCNNLTSDSSLLKVNASTVGGNCKECPNDFHCYGNPTFGYKWFVSGYQMDGFALSVDQYCVDAGIPKPTWKGKAAGDANCDGAVNGADLSIWRREYVDVSQGQSVSRNNWEADFTGPTGQCDGIVNGADYSLWRRSYIDLGGGR